MKKKITVFLTACFAFILFSSCGFGPGYAHYSGEVISDQRDVPSFNAINISSGIDLVLSQGNTQKLVVRADKDLLDDVITEVHGDELRIYCDRHFWRNSDITVEVTFVSLNELKASAGSDVKSENRLSFDLLTLSASSGSDLHLDLEANGVELSASSGSDARISGRSDHLSIRSSSGSDVNTYDLEANDVTVKTSSGSDVRVNCRNTIHVDASGGSDVYVRGNPEKQYTSTSGGSDVYFR